MKSWQEQSGFSWRPKDGFLEVRFLGERAGPEYMVSLWRALFAKAESAGIDALLVHDHMVDPPLQGEQQQQFVREFVKLPVGGKRIAYVVRAAEELPLYETTQLLVQEFHLSARAFADANEAEVWLRYASMEQ